MSLKDLIRRPVETLPPGASAAEAARLMRDRNIGSVIVVRDGSPVGVVTDRDLALRVVAEDRPPTGITLESIMSPHPAFLSVRRSLDEAIETMRDWGVRRLPIVDEAGQLEGIVSMDDILAEIGRQIGALGEAVQREIRASE